MDTNELVRIQIETAIRLVRQLIDDGLNIMAFAWMKLTDESSWRLYIATALYETSGPAAAYRAVQNSLLRLGNTNLTLSDITVTSPENPIAKGILKIQTQNQVTVGTFFSRFVLDGMIVDQVYVYPEMKKFVSSGGQMSPREIMQKVIDLMDQSGILGTSIVTLTDGATFQGVPIGLELLNDGTSVKFMIDPSHSPRNYPISQIMQIR